MNVRNKRFTIIKHNGLHKNHFKQNAINNIKIELILWGEGVIYSNIHNRNTTQRHIVNIIIVMKPH